MRPAERLDNTMAQMETDEGIQSNAVSDVETVDSGVLDATHDPTDDDDADDAASEKVLAEEDTDEGETVGIVKKITSDGGVTKRIITKGSGWRRPETGDEVRVNYVGRLVDPEDPNKEPKVVFDSNTDKSNPFSFTLGKGHVIKGWDKGVATMMKGEKAVFVIKPEYAYGAQPAGDKIPANSTLEFEVTLLSWKSVNALSDDGRVTLTMVRKDESAWQTPKDSWEVTVEYSARLAGSSTPLSTNPDFHFTVQPEEHGHTPNSSTPAFFSTAIKRFHKGDIGILRLPPEHHPYGISGNANAGVPANSEIEYEIKLVGWMEVETLEGAVVKKTVREGSGWEKPSDSSKIKIRLRGKTESGKILVDTWDTPEANLQEVVLGEGDLPELVEVSISSMKKGELAEIRAPADWGYLPAQNAEMGIAETDTLVFEVELVDFAKVKESWQMEKEEKLQSCEEAKEHGNRLFRAGKVRAAIRKYERANRFILNESDFSDPVRVRTLKLSTKLNTCACHAKTRNWSKVYTESKAALDIDKSSVKARYRYAQALFYGRQEFELAKAQVDKALEVEPKDVALRGLRKEIGDMIRKQEKKERALFKGLFEKLTREEDGNQVAGASSGMQPMEVDAK